MPAGDGPINHRGFLIENINDLEPEKFYLFLDLVGMTVQGGLLEDVVQIDTHLSINPSGIVSTLDGVSHASRYHEFYFGLGANPLTRLNKALEIYNQHALQNAPKK